MTRDEIRYETNYTYDNNGNQLSKATYIINPPGDIQYPDDNVSWSAASTKSSVGGGVIGIDPPIDTQPERTLSEQEISIYNTLNQLVSVSTQQYTASYDYRPDGLRFSKTVGATYSLSGDGSVSVKTVHVWDGMNMIAELDELGNVTDRYVRGLNLIYSDNQGYYVYNAHGDVVQLTDDTGAVTREYHYDSFGIEGSIDDTDTNPFRYCAEYFDWETGNIYLRARYYSPRTGRFTQSDPIRDGLNWYTYAGNNPIRYVDPRGLAAMDVDSDGYSGGGNNKGSTSAPAGSTSNIPSVYEAHGGQKGSSSGNTVSSQGSYSISGNVGAGYHTNDRNNGSGQNHYNNSSENMFWNQSDLISGLAVVIIDDLAYADVTIPVLRAFRDAAEEASEHTRNFIWFYNQVNHGAIWDIKIKENWENTIGISFPGSYNIPIIFMGEFTSPEVLGNMMYGFTGSAIGFMDSILLSGGDYAAGSGNGGGIIGGIQGFFTGADPKEDKDAINKGIYLYKVRRLYIDFMIDVYITTPNGN